MASQAEIRSINGHVLGAGALVGVTGEIVEGGQDATSDPQYVDRGGLPPEFVQAGVDAHEVVARFRVEDYAAKAGLLGAIDYPNTDDPIELQSYWGDPDDPTLCTDLVAARNVAIGPGNVDVRYSKGGPVWWADVVTEHPNTITAAGDEAAVLINKGHVRTAPFFKLGWTVQRASFSADCGWRYRRQVTISNPTTEDWEDELVSVLIGDTAAWVTATKAQADGDDVRVWRHGQEHYRTLTCFNTKAGQVHFLVSIPAGGSATYDIVYGNSAATSPRDLSTRNGSRATYVGPDLEGDSGTASAGSTTTLTDATKSWETDRWKGGFIGLVAGTGSVRWRRIASNTGTVITFNRALNTAGDNTTQYVIWKSGVMMEGGRVTTTGAQTITDNLHTRKWGVNQLKGATVTFHTGTTASPATMTVSSNTTDTITFSSSFSVNPTVGDSYTIQRQGIWSYFVDTASTETDHRGGYRINSFYTAPTMSKPNGDTPAGWKMETYLPNDDDYCCHPAYNVGSGGGHAANYWPLMRSIRRVRQDAMLKGEGLGDGWSLFSPVGFQGWYFDYQVQNENGVGQVVFASQDVGGADWQDMVTYTTTQASLTNIAAQHINTGDYNYPTRLFMGVLPFDGIEIPTTAAAGDQVEIRPNDVLEVYHYLSGYGSLSSSVYSLGSETECYELQQTIRIGGGSEAQRVPPFEEIVIGGEGHRVMLPADYELWIATNPAPGVPLFGIYNSTYDLVEVAAWAGVIYRHIKDADGDDLALQSREFSPLPVALNMVENGYFGADVSGWTGTPSASVSAAISWDSGQDAADGIGTGSLKVAFSSTPAGAWTYTLSIPTIDVTPGKAYDVGFAYRASSLAASLDITLNAIWEQGVGADAATVLGGPPAAINTWYLDADGNSCFKLEPGLFSPYASTDELDLEIVISGNGSYTGNVWIDWVTVGVPAIHLSEPNPGTTTCQVSWREGYLS